MTTEIITWVRANERLPDHGMEVLVLRGDSFFMAWHDGNSWLDCDAWRPRGVDFWAEVNGPAVTVPEADLEVAP